MLLTLSSNVYQIVKLLSLSSITKSNHKIPFNHLYHIIIGIATKPNLENMQKNN